MRLLAVCLLAVGGAASLAVAVPAPKEKTTGQKLLGTWKLVRSDQPLDDEITYFVDLGKDGTMTLRIVPKEKEAQATVFKGTYKVADDKIDYTLDMGPAGKKQEVLTIKKLTDHELVTTDPDNIKEEFERVKAKEKPKEPAKD